MGGNSNSFKCTINFLNNCFIRIALHKFHNNTIAHNKIIIAYWTKSIRESSGMEKRLPEW